MDTGVILAIISGIISALIVLGGGLYFLIRRG